MITRIRYKNQMQKLNKEYIVFLNLIKGKTSVPIEDVDIDIILKQLYRHKLLSLSSVLISEANQVDKNRIKQELKKWSFRSLLLTNEVVNLNREFIKNAIEPIYIKGPVLAYQLYNDVAGRYYTDLDLLIKESDLNKAIAILKKLNYTSYIPIQHFSFTDWQKYLKAKHDVGFYHSGKRIYLELHLRLSDGVLLKHKNAFYITALKTSVQFYGHKIITLRTEENFIYLCYHASIHGFFRLSWLRDIATYIKRSDLNNEIILSKVSSLGLNRVFALSLILAKKYFQLDIPEIYAPLIKECRHLKLLERICDRFIWGPERNQLKNILKPGSLFRMNKSIDDQNLRTWLLRYIYGLLRHSGIKYKFYYIVDQVRKKRVTKTYTSK